jgi:SAM-dependent methyltransferase
MPKDDSVDCCISNLTLQIVSDPKKMLAECFRVTKPGGKCIFSVWGNEEDSQNVTIWNKMCEKFDIEQDPRSNFYLNDRCRTIKMLEDAGFTHVLAWESMTPSIPVSPQEEEDEQIRNRIAKVIEVGIERYKAACDYFVCEVKKTIEIRKFPIGLSILFFLGTKPK